MAALTQVLTKNVKIRNMRQFGLLLAVAFSVHAAEPDFTHDVQPVLAKRCSACHGAGQQMGGLRLDSGSGVLKGSKNGAVVVKGDSSKSRLMERVSSDKPGFKMPPVGEPLTSAEISSIKSWIDAGAKAPLREYASLVVPAHQAVARSECAEAGLGSKSDRRVRACAAGIGKDRTFARGFEGDSFAARISRFDRTAADSCRD